MNRPLMVLTMLFAVVSGASATAKPGELCLSREHWDYNGMLSVVADCDAAIATTSGKAALEFSISKAARLAFLAKPDDAAVIIDKVLVAEPKNAPAWFVRGLVRLVSSDPLSIAAFDTCTSLSGGSPGGELDCLAMRALALNIFGRGKESRAAATAVLKRYPQQPVALLTQATHSYADGDYAVALATIDKAISGFEGHPLYFGATARIRKAECLARLKRTEEAAKVYDEAVSYAPHIPAVHFSRGLFFQLQGRHERAIADFTAALNLQPHYQPVYEARALSYLVLGQTESADKDRATFDTLASPVAKRSQ
jgi:tetratricopeptide (TPR) repeat protein